MDSTHEKPFHALSTDQIAELFETNVEQGLNEQEAQRRLEKFGANTISETEGPGALTILINQFKSVVILILVVAGLLALSLGHYTEAIAILVLIAINTLIGFTTEWRALKSVEALREISGDTIRVRRNGTEEDLDTDQLVPGDLIIFESGDFVPADIRILEGNNLQVKEAALTGESVSVRKQEEPADDEAPLAERTSMLYRGTTIAQGSGKGIVVATGDQTELGTISELTEEAESETTPLQKRLNELGNTLAWITIAIASVIAAAGLLTGQDPRMIIETAIALGVAAIPEGLPIVATIALARGVYLMVKRNALINKLPAVETLGATRVILTDKTGTITENEMTLRMVSTPKGEFDLESNDEGERNEYLTYILKIAVLCNNASLVDEDNDLIPEQEQGDPTETALLRAGLKHNLDRDKLLKEMPELREVPFDSDEMKMATYHQYKGEVLIAVKGAPDKVIECCSSSAESLNDELHLGEQKHQKWKQKSEELASEGLRVLAIADKRVDDNEAEPYSDLRFLGLVGLYDPPREDVKESIADCHRAGIRVVMVTGDQPKTAGAIARATGISKKGDKVVHGSDIPETEDPTEEQIEQFKKSNVYARVSPRQKLNLVKIFQQQGDTVAMTGDGVNDTPALKKADIGVAMGKRGTDAARQVADMVLLDDAFPSIVTAVRYGRIIFQNIRKSVMFMLCTNVAEVIAVAAAVLIGSLLFFPIPLLPLQILYLNVITDVLPALALGVVAGEAGIMNRKPRPGKENILTRSHWFSIGGWATLISICVLSSLAYGIYQLGFEEQRAVTISFLTLAFGKLWFTFNLRSSGSSFLDNEIIRNPWIIGAILTCIVLLLAAVYLPFLSGVLQTSDPGRNGWILIAVGSLIPFIWGQGLRYTQSVKSDQEA
ncbi:MAG: HAD-IC family P-type ATPase [Bacteroidetes bacterium]|jgi:Ca2+-transporting ATPase|nr:HAD-IC family P-type ATPase [Bacteroidota bacterium]